MKPTIASSLCVLVVLAALPAPAAVVLNFDNLTGASPGTNGSAVPDASYLSTEYFVPSYGLRINSFTFSLADPHVGVGVANLGSSTNSPPNAIAGVNTIQQFHYASFLSFTFVDPANPSQSASTDFFSLQDPINSGDQITMYAFSTTGLLGSVTHTADGSATWSLAFPGMQFVRFGDPDTRPIYAADNVTFDPVPEPASLLLLSTASLLLLRKRSAAA
jgi:hypothetical protein